MRSQHHDRTFSVSFRDTTLKSQRWAFLHLLANSLSPSVMCVTAGCGGGGMGARMSSGLATWAPSDGPKSSFMKHTYSICLYWCLNFSVLKKKMRIVYHSAFWVFPEIERQFQSIKQKAASLEILWKSEFWKFRYVCKERSNVSRQSWMRLSIGLTK